MQLVVVNPQQIKVIEFGLYELGLNLGVGACKTQEWKTWFGMVSKQFWTPWCE